MYYCILLLMLAFPPHTTLVAQGLAQLSKILSAKTRKVSQRTSAAQGKRKVRICKK